MLEIFVVQIFPLEGFDMTSVKVLNYSTSVTSLIGDGNYMWWHHNVQRTNNFFLIQAWKIMMLVFGSDAVNILFGVCEVVGWGGGGWILLTICSDDREYWPPTSRNMFFIGDV